MTFLTRDEVRELTGRAHRETQKAVLRANGIAYYVNASGWAVVPRSAVEGRMQASKPKWSPRGQTQQPA